MCGLPVALSVTVIVPGWLPVAVGVKVTVMVQLAPAATEAPQAGEPSPGPVRYMSERYPIFQSACQVPAAVFGDPDLVVEKFLPEKDERGYYVRYWVFLGERERCSRYLEAGPIVKGDQAIERVPVPVPDEIRAWRRRLGFDYGKFDFVIHDGRPVLLDVNRTPTVPPNLSAAVRKQQAELAEGIEALLRGRSAAPSP